MRNIPFSPPDITEEDIQEVVETLRSGWITTGPRTKTFEVKIAEYCETKRAVCLNSATAGMELILRLLGIGKGDEVITSAYTYTASASVIEHVGAKIVLVDTAPNSYEMELNMSRRPTIQIVAEAAGVSCGTVDRVLNNRAHVNPDVRERGLLALKKTGYLSPGEKHQQQLDGETLKLGVLLPN